MDTNKMRDISREQFEAWAWREYGQLLWWDMSYSEVFRRDGESYMTEFLSVRWEAWQASREAVVVELPEKSGDGRGHCSTEPYEHYGDGWDECLENAVALIEAQGLRVTP